MIRVTVWNEYDHERESADIAKIYPDGIHGCIAAFLAKDEEIQIRTATFDMPEHGLPEEVLSDTDVLIIWSHILQEEFCALFADVPVEVVYGKCAGTSVYARYRQLRV